MPNFFLKNTTKNKKIVYRADANARIGHGHLSRLLALADMLQPEFAACFVCCSPSPAMVEQIAAVSEQWTDLPSFSDPEEEAHYLVREVLEPDDLLVTDGYQFGETYQRIVRTQGIRLVCLDDLTAFPFVADAVLNPAGGLTARHYQGQLYTRYGLGTDYALLRAPFRQAAGNRRQNIAEITKIFVCMGGADSHNITEKVSKACLALPSVETVQVVTGSSYRYAASLQSLVEKHAGRLQLHRNLSAQAMVELIQSCHLAIAPASTISYELCMTGIGLITGTTATNQKGIAAFLEQSGCALGMGNLLKATEDSLQQLLAACSADDIRLQLEKQAAHFRDNTVLLQSFFRKIAMEQQLKVRKAVQDDLLTYYYWANEAESRKQAIHTEPIALHTHSVWFMKKIDSTEDFLFIFEKQQQPVGQVRFERREQQYIISFSVDTAFRGQGWGTVLMKMALEALQQQLDYRPKVKAYVRTDNIASLKVFRQNSFHAAGQEIINHVLLETFEK